MRYVMVNFYLAGFLKRPSSEARHLVLCLSAILFPGRAEVNSP